MGVGGNVKDELYVVCYGINNIKWGLILSSGVRI